MAKIKIRPLYLVVVSFLAVIFLPGYTKFMELRAKNAYLENEIDRLEKENLALYKEKQKLEEDIHYIEKVARDTMGVAKDGEIPIKIEK